MSEPSITISPRAAKRIVQLVDADQAASLFRVSVEGGGCSGFQYRFELASETSADDILIERDGATVAIDPVSADFVRGSEIDFVEELIGSSFQIRNPNASSSCGCGSSFAI